MGEWVAPRVDVWFSEWAMDDGRSFEVAGNLTKDDGNTIEGCFELAKRYMVISKRDVNKDDELMALYKKQWWIRSLWDAVPVGSGDCVLFYTNKERAGGINYESV